jgi:hypothetical protein
VIPVEVTQTPWHYTNFWDWLDHWQTLIAGGLALLAAVIAVCVTWRQIVATREQTALTEHLDKDRRAREASAFHAMLKAAMTRVIDEVEWARKNYPDVLTKKAGSSPEGLTVRRCITKGAFAELRAVCVRQGGPLTAEFLDLESEIDNFALQWEYFPAKTEGALIPLGKHADMREQLERIKTMAAALHDKAAERI